MPFYPLMFKAVTIDLVLVYLLSRAERTAAIETLTELLMRNALNIRISDVFALEDTAIAHDVVASGQRSGSVILTI